jgi:hypothetical protein
MYVNSCRTGGTNGAGAVDLRFKQLVVIVTVNAWGVSCVLFPLYFVCCSENCAEGATLARKLAFLSAPRAQWLLECSCYPGRLARLVHTVLVNHI